MNKLLNEIRKSNFIKSFTSEIKKFKHRYRSRKLLSKLSDELLNDIGLTRAEANLEAGKYFGRVKLIKRL